MKRQLPFLAVAFALTLALFVAAAAIAAALSLRGDVAGLQQQVRNAARTQKDLHADIASIRDDLAALDETPAAAGVAPVSVATAVPPAVIDTVAPVRAAKVTAIAPPECVFQSGDPYRLADCIRSQQERIGAGRIRTNYR